ncbi:MAG: nodulation protein NfeD [Chloroflexota bacterium]|nr:MAG: nodulation protein NfeD [Chloroflexota bacterium]
MTAPRARRPRRVRRRTLRISILLATLGLLAVVGSIRAAGPEVVILPTTGIVDEGMARYLADGIDQAERDGAAAVVIKLNTPGGSLFSTQEITGTFIEAKIPIIVWVAPAGGFAASAGTFITLASNLSLMAPATSIGAASPVGAQGEDIEGTEGKKVLETAIKMITSIADARGRPVDWAVSTVEDAKSYTVTEAIAAGAVDGMAATIEEVIAFADGRTVETAAGPVLLDLADATIAERSMNPFLAFIRLLSDPNIAFLLFSVGSAGLLAEVWSPNFVTGIIGALAIILAFIGLGALPLNVGGLILIVFAIVLFGLELTVTSHGLLGFAGVVCLGLGASALFTSPVDPFEPFAQVALPVILTVSITFGVIMVLIVFGAIRSRGLVTTPGTAGAPFVLGSRGTVRRPLEPLGSVYVSGEEWTARAIEGVRLERGVPVHVVGVDGLTLVVEPDPSSSEPT